MHHSIIAQQDQGHLLASHNGKVNCFANWDDTELLTNMATLSSDVASRLKKMLVLILVKIAFSACLSMYHWSILSCLS